MIPGTDGLPNIAGLPPIMTLVEIDAIGTGSTVLVVHGLLAGVGGKPAMLGNPSVPGITDGAPVPCPTLMVLFPGQVLVMANG